MSLAKDLANYTPIHPKCTMGTVLREMTPADRKAILGAMSNPRIPGSHIARTLTNHGSPVRAEAVQRHRRGACTCERDGL